MKATPIKSLAEVAESVQYGYTASASDSAVGPHFLRITDIVPSQIDWGAVPYCEIDEKVKDRFALASGDIVIARTGATVGYAKLIRDNPEAVFASYLVRIRVDSKLADPSYVGRIVESDAYKKFVLSRVGGAAQPNANAKVLSAFRLPIPARETQARIVDILSAYDDLIENNRRRIQLLEQAARLLYKEWFVHLRFPGHEHTKIHNGIPEGWKEGCVGNLASVKSGFAFKSRDWQQEGNPVIKIKNITGDGTVDTTSCDYVTDTVAEKAASFAIPIGALLIAMTGATVGKVGLLSDSTRTYYLNQRVGLFNSKNGAPIERYLFPFFQEGVAQTQVINLAGGAAQPNISGGQIESIQLLIPDNKIFALYLEVTKAAFQQRQTLLEQNEKLAQARGLLLPRLMNGEVTV